MQRKLFKGKDPSTLDWGTIRQQMQGAGLGDKPPAGMAESVDFQSEVSLSNPARSYGDAYSTHVDNPSSGVDSLSSVPQMFPERDEL